MTARRVSSLLWLGVAVLALVTPARGGPEHKDPGECPSRCTPGATTCRGDGVSTCIESTERHCSEWSRPTRCAERETCRQNGSTASCQPRSTCSDTQSDPNNCGTCGHSCLGGACSAGVCQPVNLASGQSGPTALVVVRNRVYWLNNAWGNPAGSSVMAVGTDGTGMTTLATWGGNGSNVDPNALATDGVSLYWTNHDGMSVMRVGLDGTGFATIATNQSYPNGIASGGSHLFWATSSNAQGVVKSNLDGSGLASLSRDGAIGIATDGTSLYWTDAVTNKLTKAGLDGSNPIALASIAGVGGEGSTQSVAVGGGYVYWCDYGASSIARVGVGGAGLATIASGQNGPIAVATDGSDVYWVTYHYCRSLTAAREAAWA